MESLKKLKWKLQWIHHLQAQVEKSATFDGLQLHFFAHAIVMLDTSMSSLNSRVNDSGGYLLQI